MHAGEAGTDDEYALHGRKTPIPVVPVPRIAGSANERPPRLAKSNVAISVPHATIRGGGKQFSRRSVPPGWLRKTWRATRHRSMCRAASERQAEKVAVERHDSKKVRFRREGVVRGALREAQRTTQLSNRDERLIGI